MLIRKRAVAAAAPLFAVILMLAATATSTQARKVRSSRARCPIGFAVTHIKDNAVCYRLKGPETYDEKYAGCAGNLYASQLLRSAEFTPHEVRMWADYTNLYSGGPFVDWSYQKSTGEVLKSTFEVKYKRSPGLEEDLCTAVEPLSGNLTAVNCDEKHYRYCFVLPYEDVARDGCGEGYVRMRSPLSSCVQSVSGVAGAAVRATWRQAQGMCNRRGGRLLQHGWRYANQPALHVGPGADASWAVPLGAFMSRGDGLRWLDHIDGEDNIVEASDMNFSVDEEFLTEMELVALLDETWIMVNESYIFYEVICEQPISLPTLLMNLTSTADGHLELNVSDVAIREDDIWCFTDSATYYPSDDVKFTRVRDTATFKLKPEGDGYYWCLNADTTNYLPSDSNKELFINVEQSVVNLYAIKIIFNREYSFAMLDKMRKYVWEQLAEYIYLRSKYLQVFGESEVIESNITQKVLKEFKSKHPMEASKEDVIYDLKLKRVYLDQNTILYHAHINTVLFPLVAGRWNEFVVLFMRPVYFCQAFDAVPMLPIGQQTTLYGCKTYSCVGDFNEGVQWVESESSHCSQTLSTEKLNSTIHVKPDSTPKITQKVEPVENTTQESDESIETPSTTEMITTEVVPDPPTTVPEVKSSNKPPSPPTTPAPAPAPTTCRPSTAPPPPEQMIQDIMYNLELLLLNDSVPIDLQQMNEAADRVDELLDLAEDTEIPGRLLQLIDEVGAQTTLNGSQSAAAIRHNFGLVVADSAPGAPIRGLRLTHTNSDLLTEDAFHIITGDVNDTYLDWNTSEVVVNLPESLVDAERRVTFIVFRNDRAFNSNSTLVNSRVLSISVSNLTSFEDGDFIDIHLRPLDHNVSRDAQRACAYWHFNEDGTGEWSQDGCTFIPSKDSNTLDVCRCTHLTHFAEIISPRTVFSVADETALELISIIGCFLSIFGLLMVGLTAVVFRSWRRDFSNKIWLQLSGAIFLLAIAFLIVAFADFNKYSVLCMLSGVLLHYATLASFSWMLVAAILSYRRLVLVFTRDASHKLLRASVFAWGAPCAVVGIMLAVDPNAYSGKFVENTTGAFCYPSGLGLWISVYGPIAVALVANWTLFSLIVRAVFASRRITRHGDTGEALRCATVSFLLVFLFGLPWIFGLFSYLLPFAYLFAVTATMQGFVLFLFFVVGNKKTRDLWLNKLKIKQMQKVPVTSSSYKSSGYRGGNSAVSGAATLEAASAKPRSLTGHDDNSRFS